MMDQRTTYFRPQVLVVFLVALGLLFAGMRVPDISRPHRPKPTHRVVLETHQKNLPSHLKQCGDLVAVLPKPLTQGSTLSYHAAPQVVPLLHASPLFFPNSGRSPPVALS